MNTDCHCEDFPGRFLRFEPSSASSINVFFEMVLHLVLIYTPKEAHSQIFVTGGQYEHSRDKCAGQKKILLARPACSIRATLIGNSY